MGTSKFDIADYLDSKEMIAEYLNTVLEEGDNADVIIADCSDNNANVFYELGIAHARDKKVILITKDNINNIPFDIKHLAVIPYENDAAFLEKLDNALDNVFLTRYTIWQDRAESLFTEFKQTTQLSVTMISEDDFRSQIKRAERDGQLPDINSDDVEVVHFILFSAITESAQIEIGQQITQWISQKHDTK